MKAHYHKCVTERYGVCTFERNVMYHASCFDGLEQDCSNSSVLAMELLQSCTKPSTSCDTMAYICNYFLSPCTSLFFNFSPIEFIWSGRIWKVALLSGHILVLVFLNTMIVSVYHVYMSILSDGQSTWFLEWIPLALDYTNRCAVIPEYLNTFISSFRNQKILTICGGLKGSV